MKNFLQRHAKILFVCFFVLLTCTACSNPRGSDGKTKIDQIIASEEVEVRKGNVNIDDIEDSKLAKQYAKLDDDDTITIEPTSFSEAFSNGWFEGLIVWPIATLINKVASVSDAGIGIIVATLIIQLIVFAFTGKSQISTQRMQEIQPEIQAIQNKYQYKKDEASQMKMYQETQAIYQKYDIHPFGSLIVTFIQLPIMMGMYYATLRAVAVVNGSFLGMSLNTTPMQGIRSLNIGVIVIYALMIICQLLSTRLPQILKKRQDKKNNVKKHEYREKEQPANTTQNSMNMYMYMMTAMFAFLYISWPVAMSFYWAVSSIIRMTQSIIIHNVMNRKKKEA